MKTKKEDISDDIKKYSAIEAVGNTEGGRHLIAYLESGFISSLEELISKYKTAGAEELFPIIAGIDEKLNLLRTLKRASKNKDLALEAFKEEEERLGS